MLLVLDQGECGPPKSYRCGDVTGKKLVVVLARLLTDSHRRSPLPLLSSYSDLREAMSIENRYFTSDLSSLS